MRVPSLRGTRGIQRDRIRTSPDFTFSSATWTIDMRWTLMSISHPTVGLPGPSQACERKACTTHHLICPKRVLVPHLKSKCLLDDGMFARLDHNLPALIPYRLKGRSDHLTQDFGNVGEFNWSISNLAFPLLIVNRQLTVGV